MKRIILFCTLVLLVLVTSGCVDVQYRMGLSNNTGETISMKIASYNDSTLSGERYAAQHIPPHTTVYLYMGEDYTFLRKLYEEYNTDTLCWIVIDSSNGLELQRYYIGLTEAEGIFRNCIGCVEHYLTFPPALHMWNINMWPPYGTYDANGHRVEQ